MSESRANDLQQDGAAVVQGLEPDPVALHLNRQRRIDESRVPARIAARILEAAGEYRAAGPVQTVHKSGDRSIAVDFDRRACNGDSGNRAFGCECLRRPCGGEAGVAQFCFEHRLFPE